MFNRIAGRYDAINMFLSFGFHKQWKRRIGRFLPASEHLQVLDLAAGTGDTALELAGHCSNVDHLTALDPAKQMLEIARQKIQQCGLQKKITLELADACRIPFAENQFDAVTVSFGIRNMQTRNTVFSEVRRVLKPGGRFIILEFSQPRNIILRIFFYAYLNVMVRFLAGLVFGHFRDFQYFYHSIKNFPGREQLCAELRQSGFVRVSHVPVCWGAVAIYTAENF